MFKRRGRRSDDDQSPERLPSRDDVADELADARPDDTPVDAADLDEHLELVAFRPAMLPTVKRVAPALLIVGMLLCIPFATATPQGRELVVERGVLGLAFTWLGMIAIIVLAALVAISLSRAISNPARRSRRTDTIKLAFGESAFAASGATLAGVVIMSIDFLDMVTVIAIVFTMTFLFTWASVFPLYRASWDAESTRGPQ
ncbi:hypothetical protein GCM10011490_02380 [Pseudoclavibacter endophyticus]|uniref:Uncharacterized protein n=1 Tax=Pseudoclavibacter endophyticus TaxID=1778590 RepID=A0A6H9WM50_9MICO|nr:hypothetical protein [Pseudoclavibacter endophyticus]KAB1650223.1 hypothetical protein F8O04_08520 [Pseudoclavibacter endophyticus]GGA56055.1 hypothetical protein GCM10011490_02380 [Pseudoclavibacter endophyticus]